MVKIFKHLYIWVLIATIAGGLLGVLFPEFAASLKPLGDGFIALVKVFIAPIIFCTVVTGIANAGSMKKVGRIGAKALLYFELVSTLALAIGLLIVNWLRPGEGVNADVHTLSNAGITEYTQKAAEQSTVQFVLHIIPKTFFDAFSGSGDLIQVLLISVLFGWALGHVGKKAQPILYLMDSLASIFFAIMSAIMKLAPLGAGGAMAFTVGKYGWRVLLPLASLLGSFYLTCGIFIVGVLGAIAALTGFNIFRFIFYIRQELLLVLATSSSESALVPLMEKLERLGCSRSVVGLVVPAGYSFNLDGTNIYLTMAAIFIAQACNIELSWGQQVSLLGVAIVTSKGASGVTGAGFITLAATLAVVPEVPVAGLALILGVDRLMSEARALTNFIGNGVATIFISRWERELNVQKLRQELLAGGDLGYGDPDVGM